MNSLNKIVIVRLSSEVALKNTTAKRHFIHCLIDNLKTSFDKASIGYDINPQQNQFYIKTDKPFEMCQILKRTFGVGSFTPVEHITTSDLDSIVELAHNYEDRVKGKTFAVRVKKSGGQFDFKSNILERNFGSKIKPFAEKVDLDHPETIIHIELHNKDAYVFSERIKGQGGFPVASQGKAVCLISGGFDSVVAAWKIIKKGVKVDFVFYNMSGLANERLVLQITKVLVDVWGCHYKPKFYSIDFKEVSRLIKANVKGSCQQLILKRCMYKVADRFCYFNKYDAIITGESIAQVSSQTLANLNAISKAVKTQVIRPVVGYDKPEIMDKAKEIGTALLCEKVQEHCGISNSYPMTTGQTGILRNEEENLPENLIEDTYHSAKLIDLEKLTAKDFRTQYLYTTELPKDAVIIDCQQAHMRRAWHVPNSIHYDFEDLLVKFRKLDKKPTYILYCTYGSQTPYVAEVMQQSGFDAYAFQGGISQVKRTYEASMAQN